MVVRIRQIKPNQWVLPVHVTPKSGKEGFAPLDADDTSVRIKVTAPPEKGEANTAVIALLAKSLQVPKRDIVVMRGDASRQKQMLVFVTWDTAHWVYQLSRITASSADLFEVLP